MKRKQKRGQFSFEYIVVIAFIMATLLPITYFYLSYNRETEIESAQAQVNVVGKRLMQEAEEVYYSGGYTKRTLHFRVPQRVKDIEVLEENRLLFTFDIGRKDHTLTYFSNVPIEFIKNDQFGPERIISITRFIISNKKQGIISICTNLNEADC